jgi:hypothetical protein
MGQKGAPLSVSTSAQSSWSASLSWASANLFARFDCPSVLGEITGDISLRIVECLVEGGQRIWSV